jgi:hypothetical protein
MATEWTPGGDTPTKEQLEQMRREGERRERTEMIRALSIGHQELAARFDRHSKAWEQQINQLRTAIEVGLANVRDELKARDVDIRALNQLRWQVVGGLVVLTAMGGIATAIVRLGAK